MDAHGRQVWRQEDFASSESDSDEDERERTTRKTVDDRERASNPSHFRFCVKKTVFCKLVVLFVSSSLRPLSLDDRESETLMPCQLEESSAETSLSAALEKSALSGAKYEHCPTLLPHIPLNSSSY